MGDFPEEEGKRKKVETEQGSTWFRLVAIVFQMLQIKIMTNVGSMKRPKYLPEWSG